MKKIIEESLTEVALRSSLKTSSSLSEEKVSMYFEKLNRALRFASEGDTEKANEHLDRLSKALNYQTKLSKHSPCQLHRYLTEAVAACRAYLVSYNPIFLQYADEQRVNALCIVKASAE